MIDQGLSARIAGVAPPLEAPAWFVERLEPLALPGSPRSLWQLTVGVVIVVPALALGVAGVAPAMFLLVCLLGALATAFDLGRHRSDRLVDHELPAVLDAISHAVRSGSSLATALHEASETASGAAAGDLRHIAAVAVVRGAPAGLAAWRERRPTSAVRLTVAALSLSAELGGAARPIDGVAVTLRERLALEHETRALSAQARASAVVIIAAPLVFVLVMCVTDPDTLSFFLRSTLGLACLAGGVVADAVAAWWMLRIVRRAS